jgi:uncharacterized Ntn-hydrolase superfamily protein
MRRAGPALVFVLVLTLALPAAGGESKRYGVARDARTYPQATAKEALASALKAIDAGKFAYLVAQLADPAFVDDRVKRVYGGKFDEQVQDTRARLDPATVKQLRRFLEAGKWTVEKDSAVVTLDDVKDRAVRLVRKDGRWYLKHDFDPPDK